jgi:hypothetical protein
MKPTSNRYPFIRALAIACALLLGADPARAVTITTVTVGPRDAKAATVQFDITWDNSWRHEGNHDAVWVFFKVRAEGEKEWQHVRLAADKVLNPTGYSQQKGGTPLDFIVPDGEDGFLGMFVRRAEYGVGKVAATNVTAVWDLTANKGIAKDAKLSVRAIGIEMVYVAEGPFYLGMGGTEPYHFYQYTDGKQHIQPYRVTSAGAIPTGQQAGKLWARKGAQPEDKGEIPAAFPNGYAAVYCIRHPLYQKGQYAGFLSMLEPAQAKARTSENEGLSWADGAAFAAWAALRPMTELEYEKISRGPIEPGWDTGDALNYPSYWEVESMNGWRTHPDRPVTVGNAKGRSFKGTHGRGTLALPADWPQEDAVGAGYRGGFGMSARPAYRLMAAETISERHGRAGLSALRGVRTAPKGVGP